MNAKRTTIHALGGVSLAVTAMLLTGCPWSDWSDTEIDQSKLCIADTDQQAAQCSEGELLLARFDRGNSQTSDARVLNTVALYCNTNHDIVRNSAGVLCVLTHARTETLDSSAAGPQQPAPQGGGGPNDR
ncbi:hypothetical protein [Salinisphaera orenii]|uniref:hypothetical protein n=1 Tax=Salinisphaera orenii TaxID=856731 RepID=UPI0011CE850A|nr:hypothetical protein [Salinisphaera halophila]